MVRGKPNALGEVAEIVASIKSPTIEATKLAQRTNNEREARDRPGSCDQLLQRQEQSIAQISAPGQLIAEFPDLRAQTDILRAVQGPLRSVASGANCYLRFFQDMGVPEFPLTQETARRRGATINPGKAYGQYANRPREADLVLGSEPTWRNSEIRTIAKGLPNAHDSRCAFSNFAQSGDLFRILGRDAIRPPLEQAADISYISPRGTFGNAPITEGSEIAPLLKSLSQEPVALIGAQASDEIQDLATNPKYRQNIRGGCVLLRPCLCHEPETAARALFPSRFWWEMICDSVRFGDHMRPKTPAHSTNRQIKDVVGEIGYGQGRKYSPRAIRRGSNGEIKKPGAAFATIAKSGAWAEAGFKCYLGIQRGETRNISRLLLRNADSNSEGEEIPPGSDRELRPRLNTIPMVLKRGGFGNIRKRAWGAPAPAWGRSGGNIAQSTPDGAE